MSSRQIAPVLGVSRETVVNDMASEQNCSVLPGIIRSSDGIERFAPRHVVIGHAARHWGPRERRG